MTTNMHSTRTTSIRIALLPDPTGRFPGGETLGASPVPDLPGHYRLLNNSFYASLRLHDVVCTQLDGTGRPQVVGVHELHPGPVSWVSYPEGLALEEVRRIGDSWRELGSEYSEGDIGYLVTSWIETATPASVREVIAATAPDWTVLYVTTAAERARDMVDQIDFRLDPSTPEDIKRQHDAECGCESGLDDDL